MARYYYDDGSFIDLGDDGTSIAYNTAGVPVSKVEADGDYFRSPNYWVDAREEAKLGAYAGGPSGDTRPWYEKVAEYGITRAIDNHFGYPEANKTMVPASFAGQNGKTYSQVGVPGAVGGGSWLPIALVGVVAALALAG